MNDIYGIIRTKIDGLSTYYLKHIPIQQFNEILLNFNVVNNNQYREICCTTCKTINNIKNKINIIIQNMYNENTNKNQIIPLDIINIIHQYYQNFLIISMDKNNDQWSTVYNYDTKTAVNHLNVSGGFIMCPIIRIEINDKIVHLLLKLIETKEQKINIIVYNVDYVHNNYKNCVNDIFMSIILRVKMGKYVVFIEPSNYDYTDGLSNPIARYEIPHGLDQWGPNDEEIQDLQCMTHKKPLTLNMNDGFINYKNNQSENLNLNQPSGSLLFDEDSIEIQIDVLKRALIDVPFIRQSPVDTRCIMTDKQYECLIKNHKNFDFRKENVFHCKKCDIIEVAFMFVFNEYIYYQHPNYVQIMDPLNERRGTWEATRLKWLQGNDHNGKMALQGERENVQRNMIRHRWTSFETIMMDLQNNYSQLYVSLPKENLKKYCDFDDDIKDNVMDDECVLVTALPSIDYKQNANIFIPKINKFDDIHGKKDLNMKGIVFVNTTREKKQKEEEINDTFESSASPSTKGIVFVNTTGERKQKEEELNDTFEASPSPSPLYLGVDHPLRLSKENEERRELGLSYDPSLIYPKIQPQTQISK